MAGLPGIHWNSSTFSRLKPSSIDSRFDKVRTKSPAARPSSARWRSATPPAGGSGRSGEAQRRTGRPARVVFRAASRPPASPAAPEQGRTVRPSEGKARPPPNTCQFISACRVKFARPFASSTVRKRIPQIAKSTPRRRPATPAARFPSAVAARCETGPRPCSGAAPFPAVSPRRAPGADWRHWRTPGPGSIPPAPAERRAVSKYWRRRLSSPPAPSLTTSPEDSPARGHWRPCLPPIAETPAPARPAPEHSLTPGRSRPMIWIQ